MLSTGLAVVLNSGGLLNTKGGEVHTNSCEWNHYSRVEPTYEDDGCLEYYVCCTHHESVLDRPTSGTIRDLGGQSHEFIATLQDDDFRLLPSIKKQLKPLQDLIDGVDRYYDATDGSTIDKAYRDYNALSDYLKPYVKDVDKLEAIHAEYHNYYDILIDATLNQYENQVYFADYDFSYDLDVNYGYFVDISNITCRGDCWLSIGRNVSISTFPYESIFFYAYNDSNSTRSIELRDKTSWTQHGGYINLTPRTWTRVDIPSEVFTTGNLSDLCIAKYFSGMTDQLVPEGFKFTSLYGSRYAVEEGNYMYFDSETDAFKNINKVQREPNYVAVITPDNYGSTDGDLNFRTKSTYTGVSMIEFDVMINGTGSGWWGFGHSEDISTADIYTGMLTTGIVTTSNDFRHVTLNVNSNKAEYYYFIVEVNTWHPEIYIDNIAITANGVIYTETFAGGVPSLFEDNPTILDGAVSFEMIDEEDYISMVNSDYCVSVVSRSYAFHEGNTATLITDVQYSNVSYIAFDAKVNGTMMALSNGENIWWGFAISDDASVYSGHNVSVNQRLSTNNEWKHYEYTLSAPVSGYVKFVLNPNKTECNIDLDNITFISDGIVHSESFSGGVGTVFDTGADVLSKINGGAQITFNSGYSYDSNYAIDMDATNYGNISHNYASLVTKQPYRNITSISFDLKMVGEVTYNPPSDYWFGVGHKDTIPARIYDNITTQHILTTNGTFMHFDFNLNVTGEEYLYFVSNPAHGNIHQYIDNIVIMADGVAYTDDIPRGKSILFDLGQYVSVAVIEEGNMQTTDMFALLSEAPTYIAGPLFAREGLQGNDSLLNGSISHTITGNGQYAVMLGLSDEEVTYLYVTNSFIALYVNNDVVATLPTSSNTYTIAMNNNGSLAVNSTYLGKVSSIIDQLRFVPLFSGTVSFSNINLKTSIVVNNKTLIIDGIEIPNFEEEENIVFSAYGSLRLGLLNDSSAQDYADAGFTKALGLFDGRSSYRTTFDDTYDLYLAATGSQKEIYRNQLLTLIDEICEKANTDAMTAMSYYEKYGVKYIVINNLIFELIGRKTVNGGNYIQEEDYEMIFERAFNNDAEYLKGVAYAGNFLQDEPDTSTTALAHVLAAIQLYYHYMNELGLEGEPLVNLLPGIASDSTYKTYLDYYFANIAPILKYVSFDRYVLNTDGIDPQHLANLEAMAYRILISGDDIELRAFIFAHHMTEGSHRAITLADEIRFQAYSSLAFGARELTYYAYQSNTDTETDTHCMVNYYTGEKANTYYFASEVNNEILTFGKTYRHYRWQGLIAKKKSGLFVTCKPISNLQHSISSHAGLASYSYSQHTLIGCFGDKMDNYAYLVMNYNDPLNASNTDNVTLTFNSDINVVVVYQNGEKHAYRVNDHKITLSLMSGRGAFVTPLSLD